MNSILEILEQEMITKDVYKMKLYSKEKLDLKSGQFINIKVESFFLRRPISVCDFTEQTITIVYKVFGNGTKKLSCYKVGETLDCLVGLGNGFSAQNTDNVVLVGGGVGIPPLYNLAKSLNNPTIVLGFKTIEEAFLIEEFKELKCEVVVCCEDGSGDFRGNVVEYLVGKNYSYYYSCGPEKMLLSLVENVSFPGQLSFEERMGCGFGACMGCSKLTKNGAVRVCVEGPVLESEVIIYEN